jgi:signal transduction histidine kinase
MVTLKSLRTFWGNRVEMSDRAIVLWIRWLFFLVLSFLFLYTYSDAMSLANLWGKTALLVFYAVSNLVLMWGTRSNFALERWGAPLFLLDTVLVSVSLYFSAGPDTELYIMCFLIIYLSTLGRRLHDALPLTFIASFLYGLLLFYKNPHVDFMEPRLLLRFPFFFVLSLFASYLSEHAEMQEKRIRQMKEIQQALSGELQRAMVDLRDKQSALMQAEKLTAMGHMAGALAHEIRNPLSVIVGYVNDLLENRGDEDLIVKPLKAIRRSAERCHELMDNLLRFSRQPKEVELFKLKDALQEAMTLARMSAKMSQVQCNLDVQADPLMKARRSEIQQIFINLMANAVDAMPTGGTLTVTLEEEDSAGHHWVKVSVQDTGEGIPPEIRRRIFEPFFTTKGPQKGTGLGLSIVRDIVGNYQGVLEVQSEVHQGTTFVIRLPAIRPDAVPEAA